MKNLRLVIAGAASVCFGASAFLIACSSDTTVNATTDAGPSPEASSFDTGVQDAGPDVADTGTDADFDGGIAVETFGQQLAERLCQSLARCCYGNANLDAGAAVDGGTYDQAACIAQYKLVGFEGSSLGTAVSLTAGNVTVDQTKGLDCLQKVSALTCDLSGADYQAVAASCFGAYVGKLADGAPCRGSVECSATSFCQAPVEGDGGIIGTCAPLRALGAPCGDFTSDFNVADTACSFRASGIPELHCDSIADFNTGTPKPTTDWTCAANVANGGNCVGTNWCAEGICNPGVFTCESPHEFFAGACPLFVK